MRNRLRGIAYTLTACMTVVAGGFFAGVATAGESNPPEWSERQDTWHGFPRHHFTVDGRDGYVVAPKEALFRKPWVWRARFPEYHAEIDLRLLDAGFHVAYLDVVDLYGSPQAVGHGNRFYEFLTKRGFDKKVALEGVSRGGLFIYNWAAENLDKVSCIYADTPVCDFKSWPGDVGKGVGSAKDWKQCLEAYGLTEEQALDYQKNPVDRIKRFAEARIPIMHIVSENDQVVPPSENTYLMFQQVPEAYRRHNFRVLSVGEGTKESKGHHFRHTNPGSVFYFIFNNTVYEGGSVSSNESRTLEQINETYASIPPLEYTPPTDRFQHLAATLRKLQAGPELRVVMLGDSIVNDTARSQWHQLLKRAYPWCKVTQITSVRGSTGCWWYKGNQRVVPYVLEQHPDLVVIGGISQHNDIDSIREVIRQIRERSKSDILLMTGAFGRVDPRGDEQWQYEIDVKKTPYRAQLQNLADELDCAFLDMRAAWGQAIRQSDKDLDWFKRDPIHANPKGEQIIGRILARFLSP